MLSYRASRERHARCCTAISRQRARPGRGLPVFRRGGWVRNLPDGRVEIAAEGETEALARFEIVVRQGPRGARVDDVKIDPDMSIDPAGQITGVTGFNIR